jgi:putative tricarboxylic transport membrane protein
LIKANYIFSSVMILVGISIFMMSQRLTQDAAGWPNFFAYILIFLSICLIAETIIKSRKSVMDKSKQKKTQGIEILEKNLLYTVLSSIIYLLIMEHVGFLLVTPFYLAFLLWLMKYRSLKTILLFSICTPIIIMIVFQYLLGVPIPQGILENFL